MSDNRLVLRAISWRDLCPWLLLFRTFRLAISLPLLTLGTLAAVLIPLGWRGAETLFVGESTAEVSGEVAEWMAYRRMWPSQQFDLDAAPPSLVGVGGSVEEFLQRGPLLVLYREGIQPFVQLIRSDAFRLREWAYLLAGAVWTLLVWGLLGGAINRIAIVRLGCDQAVGFGESLRFARRRLKSYVFAPLMLLAAVVLACLPGALAGMLMRSDMGVFVASIGWLIVLLTGFIMVVLLAGVGLGWPLMWGAISAEPDGDEFEAINRSFSFALSRPLHYLCYFLLVAALGAAGGWVVDVAARSSITAARWSASWGAGAERWQEVRSQATSRIASDGTIAEGPVTSAWGLGVIDLSEDFARAIAVGFRHSFFWCAAAGIYLLLRRDVDETELDEVYLEDYDADAKLPPLSDLNPVVSAPPTGAEANSGSAVVSGPADTGLADTGPAE